jgi:phosphoserine phosphatase
VGRWPIYEHVIFDFDSTLSEIEGIDVLADNAGVGAEVSELTRQAMNGAINLEAVYEKRLSTIHPTRGDILALKEQYKKHLTEDAAAVISALLQLGHEVYIVSGGLLDPIVEIGSALGVPKKNIKAVDIQYDEFSGEWWLAQTGQINRAQPFLKSNDTELEKTHGKAGVIEKLLAGKHGRSLLVGDGTSDLAASVAVNLFLGYAGTVQRERVMTAAPAVLKCKSLAPIMIIAAGFGVPNAFKDSSHKMLAQKAFDLIDAGALHFNDKDLCTQFNLAYRKELEDDAAIF